MTSITAREQSEIARANESGKQPVLFVHGLWLLASSWDGWRAFFEDRGFTTLAVDWPDDAASVAEAVADPQRFAGKTVGGIAEHVAEVIAGLERKPILIGHSFGGLLVQKLAGQGLALATIAIDPAQFKGVKPLPLSTLKASFPVLGNPANSKKAVYLTLSQFTYGFASQSTPDEAKALYESYHVPGAGKPLFQAAFANFQSNPDTAIDTKNPARGPLLIISGEKDHIVPFAVANAAYKIQKKDNPGVTEFAELPGRAHSLVIDSKWQGVAEQALDFIEKQVVSAR